MLVRYLGAKNVSESTDKGVSEGVRIWVKDTADFQAIGLSDADMACVKQFSIGSQSLMMLSGEQKCAERVLIFENIDERRVLYVFGAGHVGRCVALLGAMLGLKVVLVDDRQEFLSNEDVSQLGIKLLLADFNKIDDLIDFAKNSVVVIVTRGHQYDQAILKQISALGAQASYVGMIGSRRRVEGVFRSLRKEGVSDGFLNRVKAPIGLELGAVTPQEIAVAIHAEIIQHFSEAENP